MLVGATLLKEEISYWEPKLVKNMWMRIFPNSDGMIPALSDSRFLYAKRAGMKVIFVSTKIATKFVAGGFGTFTQGVDNTRAKLIALVKDGFIVYYTDQHEPEDDITPTTYKANSNTVFDMIDALPSDVRPYVKAGHVLTRQWTENTTGRSYSDHDTGRGDFFGVDMYVNSWSGSTSSALTSYPSVSSFVAGVKNYKFNSSDTRVRVFPEFGAVGAPFDTDGSARAAFISGVQSEVETWGPSTTGWSFGGWIWWNLNGKEGTSITGIGTKRYFQLDRRHTGTDGSYVILNPPKPLIAYNEIVAKVATVTPPPTTNGGGAQSEIENESSNTGNILSEQTSTFETGTGEWGAYANTSILRSTAQAYSGSASLEIAAVAAGFTATGGPVYGMTPGDKAIFSAYFKAGTTARPIRLQLRFRDAANNLIGSPIYGTPTSDSTSNWTRIVLEGIAPDNVDNVAIMVEVDPVGAAVAAGEKHYMDLVELVIESTQYSEGYLQGQADLKNKLLALFPGWLDTM